MAVVRVQEEGAAGAPYHRQQQQQSHLLSLKRQPLAVALLPSPATARPL